MASDRKEFQSNVQLHAYGDAASVVQPNTQGVRKTYGQTATSSGAGAVTHRLLGDEVAFDKPLSPHAEEDLKLR